MNISLYHEYFVLPPTGAYAGISNRNTSTTNKRTNCLWLTKQSTSSHRLSGETRGFVLDFKMRCWTRVTCNSRQYIVTTSLFE